MTHKIFDALLVLQYQSGRKKAVNLLVKRWHAKLCKQAYWYTGDIEVSKDIAQDSWGTILLKLGSLKNPNSFGSWALTIVTRKAIDWRRKHKKELDNLSSYHKQCNKVGISDDKGNEKAVGLLKNAIKKLPGNQQIVLHLFYIEEYSIKQISEIMHVSAGTIKSRLFTAREKLKTILKNIDYEK